MAPWALWLPASRMALPGDPLPRILCLPGPYGSLAPYGTSGSTAEHIYRLSYFVGLTVSATLLKRSDWFILNLV